MFLSRVCTDVTNYDIVARDRERNKRAFDNWCGNTDLDKYVYLEIVCVCVYKESFFFLFFFGEKNEEWSSIENKMS